MNLSSKPVVPKFIWPVIPFSGKKFPKTITLTAPLEICLL